MQHPVAIENIEEMRNRNGIDDADLRKAIRRLRVGDSVKLTFLIGTESSAGETLRVRITHIRGRLFHGKLAQRPASAGLSRLRVGAIVSFIRDHIHSLPREQPSHEQ